MKGDDKLLLPKGKKSYSIAYNSEAAVRKALYEIFIYLCFLIVTTIRKF